MPRLALRRGTGLAWHIPLVLVLHLQDPGDELDAIVYPDVNRLDGNSLIRDHGGGENARIQYRFQLPSARDTQVPFFVTAPSGRVERKRLAL
ncbi:MAG: hypothetical protein JSV66_13125 [Trueperaceae bacterium]|nr:MAG: hypothetical protein JSV66_13125 [Trueperaceae bacterium]